MQVDTLLHECLVCGDKIELMYQVCSRFCMRALEQMEFMDLEAQMESLEAQMESPIHHSKGTKVAPVEQPPSFLNPPTTEAKWE